MYPLQRFVCLRFGPFSGYLQSSDSSCIGVAYGLSSSQAAVDSITRSLALEWGTDYNIRVNGIAPGPIDGTTGVSKLAPGDLLSMREQTPLFKLGEKWDIAMAAIYLASDAGV